MTCGSAVTTAFACLVLASTAMAQAAPPGPAAGKSATARSGPAAGKTGAYKTISWDDLLPANWDPMKDFKSVDLEQLNDNDPRATAMLTRMRKIWDEAPVNTAMRGAAVRLPGYVVPLEESRQGLKEFLLVPYFGACIHTPPPPANQIIHVVLAAPTKAVRSMDAVWINGVLDAQRVDTDMGVSAYRMAASSVSPYTDKAR